MPVILPTDLLFFILLLAFAAYAVYAYRQPMLRRTWRKLIRSRSAAVSLTIIAFYLLIAFLDSLHFKPDIAAKENHTAAMSRQVISVFDVLLTPMRTQYETSYSSPFSAYTYNKEMQPDGQYKRLRLQYGGRHLNDPQHESLPDIAMRVFASLLAALGSMLGLLFALCLWRSGLNYAQAINRLRRMLMARTDIPYRAVALTATILLTFIYMLVFLGEAYHIFGTDKIGEDVLYKALKSVRTGVLIGTVTTLIMLPFALLLGIAAGYFLGWVDDLIQYLYTTLNAIPGVLLVAAAILMLYLYMDRNPQDFDNLAIRADLRLLFLCAILGITSWTGLCRLLRAETLKVKQLDYIRAAQALGVGHLRIIAQHIMPNVMHIVFITIALDFSGLVLAEAVLSYVEIGVDPSMDSWGNMINNARLEMAREPVVWWSLAASLLFMSILVLCANLFADAVRNAFDPRTETSRQ